jgi:hypothetical protein
LAPLVEEGRTFTRWLLLMSWVSTVCHDWLLLSAIFLVCFKNFILLAQLSIWQQHNFQLNNWGPQHGIHESRGLMQIN